MFYDNVSRLLLLLQRIGHCGFRLNFPHGSDYVRLTATYAMNDLLKLVSIVTALTNGGERNCLFM